MYVQHAADSATYTSPPENCLSTQVDVQKRKISPQGVVAKRQVDEDLRRFLPMLCDTTSASWLEIGDIHLSELFCHRKAPLGLQATEVVTKDWYSGWLPTYSLTKGQIATTVKSF